MTNMKRMVVTVILGLVLAIGSANAAVIFEDDFDSYTGYWVDTLQNASGGVWSTVPWGTGAGAQDVKVGDITPGKAYFSNAFYNDVLRLCTVTTETGLSDYTVNLEAWERPGQSSGMRFYAVGRVTGTYTTYIGAGAIISSADNNVYLDFVQSGGGEPSANYYVAAWNPSMPIYVELALSGNSVTGTVTHAGLTTTLSYTTSVLNAGAFGIGGQRPWGNAIGLFDNFSVVPEPATMSLLALGIGLAGLKRRKA